MTCCWGSETSAAPRVRTRECVGVGVVGFWPGLAWCTGWCGGGCRGVLFGIFIVDASIFVVLYVEIASALSLSAFWWVGVCVEVFCLASYEGHTVDALASRADEGRRSLR